MNVAAGVIRGVEAELVRLQKALLQAEEERDQMELIATGYHHILAMMLYQNGPCSLSARTRIQAPLDVEIRVFEDQVTLMHEIRVEAAAATDEPNDGAER